MSTIDEDEGAEAGPGPSRSESAIFRDPTILDAILEALPSGLLVVDAKGILRVINPAGEQILRVRRSDAIGRPLTSLRGEYQPMLWPTDDGELLLLDAGNEPRILGFKSRHLKTAQGKRRGVVVIFADVTAAKAERRFESHRRRLADLGTLVASLAHEIRNPVFAISSLASLLGDEDVVRADPELVKLAEGISEEARRISRLVDDILHFGREKPLKRERTDVVGLIENTVEDLRGVQAARTETPVPMTVTAMPAVDEARVWDIDRDAIRQVIANLLRNAINAVVDRNERRPDDQVAVTLDVEDGQLAVDIRDDGVGIDETDLGKVFDPFFTTTGQGGTGLGLAVAERLIRAHGGTLTLRSTLGKGTTASVRLPR